MDHVTYDEWIVEYSNEERINVTNCSDECYKLLLLTARVNKKAQLV